MISGVVVDLLEMVSRARLRAGNDRPGPLILKLFLGATTLLQCFLINVVFRGES